MEQDIDSGAPFFLPVTYMGGLLGKSINTENVCGQAAAYLRCAAVRSVVNKKVQAIQNAKVWAVDESDEDIKKPSLVEAMSRPNPYQPLLKFVGQTEAYVNIFGCSYWYVIRGVGVSAKEIYVIPNTIIAPVYAATTPIDDLFRPQANIIKYRVSIYGQTLELSPDEVEVVYDATAPESTIFGSASRLIALKEQVSTFMASSEATTELMANRGALGIISLANKDISTIAQGNIPQTKAEKDAIQKELSKYGVLRNQFKYILTNSSAAFIPISSTIADLGARDAQREAKLTIADMFGVPASLIDVPDSKYNNLEQSKTIMYNDAIIPEAQNIFSALNEVYGNPASARVMPSYDHMEFYQSAKQSAATGYASLVNGLNAAVSGGLLSPTEARIQLLKFTT